MLENNVLIIYLAGVVLSLGLYGVLIRKGCAEWLAVSSDQYGYIGPGNAFDQSVGAVSCAFWWPIYLPAFVAIAFILLFIWGVQQIARTEQD